MDPAKRDKWRGKWTSVERGWVSIAKCLGNEGMLNGQKEETHLHVSREVEMIEPHDKRMS